MKRLTLSDIEELRRLKASHQKNIETKTRNIAKEEFRAGIVVNRMYVGDYLENNLGHEAINFLKADNGRHYLYLNPYGNFSRQQSGLQYMLMTKYVGNNRCEVIGMVRGLREAPGVTEPHSSDLSKICEDIRTAQLDYIERENITYLGKPLLSVFNDAEQQNIYVTYEADIVYMPANGKRIFLHYSNDPQLSDTETDNSVTVVVKQHNFSRQSLHTYIYPKETEGFEYNDYERILKKIIDREDLWQPIRDTETVIEQSLGNDLPLSIFEICGIQDDENRISNALAYFMNRSEYKALWQRFIFEKLNICLSIDYTVQREVNARLSDGPSELIKNSGGRIDLLISDYQTVIVIENKIKSDINIKESDQDERTQLNRYYNFIENCPKYSNKPQRYYIVLSPDYNVPDIKGEMDRIYIKLTYSDLVEFLDKPENHVIIDTDPNFMALRNVLVRHTYPTPNEYFYHEMMQKLKDRLQTDKTDGNI